MNKKPHQFVGEHPEYFVQGHHRTGWREGLHPLIEDYSRTMAPEHFTRIEQRARHLWDLERKRLIAERAGFVRELEKLHEERASMTTCLGAMERLLSDEKREAALAVLPRRSAPVPVSRGAWRLATPICLNLVGAVFIYLGLLVEDRATVSYVLIGIFFVAAGFIWPHASPGKFASERERQVTAPSPQRSFPQRMRLIKLQHRILREKLSHLSGRIRTLEHCLEVNQQKLQEPYV